MKNETINGMDYVILENDDKLRVTTSNDADAYVSLKKEDNKISIEGDDSIIKSFNRLEAKNSPAISNEDIIFKCDEWLSTYYDIQKILTNLTVESFNYDNMDSMKLVVSISEEYINNENVFVFQSNLYWEGVIVKNGAKMVIPAIHSEIVKYLFAHIIYDFVDHHFSSGFPLKEYLDDSYGKLSNEDSDTGKVEVNLSIASDDYDEFNELLIRVITNFNIDIYPYQIYGNIVSNMPNEYNDDKLVKYMDNCLVFTKFELSLLDDEKKERGSK